MAKQTNKEKDVGVIKQFDELKRKHPDALLLFRQGNFYELYKEDAVKAAVILAIDITDRLIPGEKEKVPTLRFPRSELDTHLPKLIRAGSRVAICDQLDTAQQKKAENKEQSISNNEDMAKKKKEKVVQEEPVKTVKNAAEDKPAQEKKTEVKAEAKNEQKSEAKQERKPREPQMVTANGEKVTHGHAYQSKEKPEDWYFTAKMDGKQLKP